MPDTKPTRNEAMNAPPRTAHLDKTLHLDNTRHLNDTALPAAEEAQRLSLSATQIMASMAAAVTAAIVGSTLGVAGTVIGAGLASVISVVGSAIIGHSILLTRKQVKRAVLQVRGADHERDGEQPVSTMQLAADDLTVVIPAVSSTDLAAAG